MTMIRRSLLRVLSPHSPKPPPRLLRLLTRHRQSHPPTPPPRPHPSHTPIFFQRTRTLRLLSSFSADTTKEGEVAQTSDPFTSFKCYANSDDSDVSYYVVDYRRPPSDSPIFSTNEKRVSPLPAAEDLLLLLQHSGQTVEHLECGSCNVYLVGVRPRDRKSSQVVEDIINHLKPEVVFLELCEHRQVVVQKHQEFVIDVKNSVFHATFEVAAQNDTKVVLGDRPFHITVRRILEDMLAMRLWEFTKLSFYLLIWFMEYGKENKVFNINGFVYKKLEELKTFPTLVQPAIHERDLYMSSVLTKIAKEHSLVVAVIGLDHILGIKKHLEQSVEISTDLSKKDG